MRTQSGVAERPIKRLDLHSAMGWLMKSQVVTAAFVIGIPVIGMVFYFLLSRLNLLGGNPPKSTSQ